MEVSREQFLAERKDCLGGSDVTDLLDMAPFGCERRLWYDKKNVPEDFPDVEESRHIRRGRRLEAIAVEEFCEEFGYGYEERPPLQMRMPGRPHVAAHVDRIVWPLAESHRKMVLEQKIPTSRNFHKIKAEAVPPDSWIAQTRWNMMVAGMNEGILAIFDASSFKSIKFEVLKSDEMISQFLLVADVFWDQLNSSVTNVFPVKSDDYGECYRCAYRTTCRGLGLTPTAMIGEAEKLDLSIRNWVLDDSIRSTALELIAAKEALKIAKDDADSLADIMKTLLAGRAVVTSDGIRCYVKEIVKKVKAVAAHDRKEYHLKVLKGD